MELVPNEFEGGVGLLGVTIKLDNYGGADERLVRVLDVEEGSPAAEGEKATNSCLLKDLPETHK